MQLNFIFLLALVGSVQGGIQAALDLFAKLIPEEKAGEFFGIFNTFRKSWCFYGTSPCSDIIRSPQ
jgi:UMF1 family MFS transporter